MSGPRSGRRRASASMASACARQAARDEIALRLRRPSKEDLEFVGYIMTSGCGRPLEERAAELLQALAQRFGLSDPEARQG